MKLQAQRIEDYKLSKDSEDNMSYALLADIINDYSFKLEYITRIESYEFTVHENIDPFDKNKVGYRLVLNIKNVVQPNENY